MSARTVHGMLAESAETYGNLPAMHQPIAENGSRKYRTWSWKEYRQAVEEIAAGLWALGFRKGDIIVVDSETRAEFFLVDIGIMAMGANSAALYPSYPVPELVGRIRAADAKAVFVQDPRTLDALRAEMQGPNPTWFLLTGEMDGVINQSQLRERGHRAAVADKHLLKRLREEATPDDYAILYLTSGATGDPKMVLTKHSALIANIDLVLKVAWAGPKDRGLAFLPSAHIAQRVVMELGMIRLGVPVWFSAGLKHLPEEIRTIGPTVFMGPPRLWERIYTSICTEIRKRPQYAQKIYYASLGLALEANKRRHAGKPAPGWMQASLKVADRVVFRKLRARLGGRMRIPCSGAAPLGKSLAQFYEAIGMPLIEGYGLTEGGVVSMNPLDAPKPGSIGKMFPGVQMKLAPDGEMLLKAACLSSGYYKDPEATRRILHDGWLTTGDLAEVDADGYVQITGRKKELIVSSNGKKIFPSRTESLFKLETIVSNVVLIGDGLPHLAALFTINTSVAETLDGMEAWAGGPASEIAVAPPVAAEVQRAVARVNKQLAAFEQIRRYRILTREFNIDSGELTATMKVRRTRVLENFREIVSEFYAGREESD